MDEDEALLHDERHMLSNVVGTDDMRIEVGTAVRLAQRDTVLLASDGLTDNVHLDEIIERVRKGPIGTAVNTVIDLARQRMETATAKEPSKPDDLSLIVFRKCPPSGHSTSKDA